MNRREVFSGGLALAAGAQAVSNFRVSASGDGASPASKVGMIAVMAELLFESRDGPEAAKALAELARATRLEAGCLRYVVAEDMAEPGRFHLSELWKDIDSLARHFATPHMAAFSATARALGYSAPYLKQIAVARISDLRPAELMASIGAGQAPRDPSEGK